MHHLMEQSSEQSSTSRVQIACSERLVTRVENNHFWSPETSENIGRFSGYFAVIWMWIILPVKSHIVEPIEPSKSRPLE